jgi:hypothetical protein
MAARQYRAAAAAALALSLACSAFAAAAAPVQMLTDDSRAGGGLSAAAAAVLLQGAHSVDRGAVRQLLANGGRSDPDVRRCDAVVRHCCTQ